MTKQKLYEKFPYQINLRYNRVREFLIAGRKEVVLKQDGYANIYADHDRQYAVYCQWDGNSYFDYVGNNDKSRHEA